MTCPWTMVGGLAPLLVATAALLFAASGWPALATTYLAWTRRAAQGRNDDDDIPTIDGHALYYNNTSWPQYEPRFNLRLAHRYGPVVRVRLQHRNRLLRLLRWANAHIYHYLYPEWHADDGGGSSSAGTVLINSLAQNQAPLKKLLAACASRAPSLAAGKYLSRGRRIVLQPYGADWLRHRRAFSMLLTGERVKARWAQAVRFEALVMAERIALSCSSSSSFSPLSSSASADESRRASFPIVDEISRFTASSVLQIAYALRATTPADPVLQELETVAQNIGAAFTPGRYWVADFPLIDLVPAFCAPWKRRLNAHHAAENGLFSRLLQSVEDRLRLAAAAAAAGGGGSGASGASDDKVGGNHHGQRGRRAVIAVEDCAAAALLASCCFAKNRPQDPAGSDHEQPLPWEQQEVAYLAAGLFEAGTETTAMTIHTFLLAAACYPGMTRRAQAEIDTVLLEKKKKQQQQQQQASSSSSPSTFSENAAPTFEDLEQMPYLAAIVRETLRLTPTGSSGVGHTPTAGRSLSCELAGSDEKEGKGVPRQRFSVAPGATVLANIYGLHHDAAAFPDPWRFHPDRWLERGLSNGHRKPKPGWQPSTSLDPACCANFAPFGFGRRICPGGALASSSLSMAICLLLWCFEVHLTDAAPAVCAAMLAQYQDECRAWLQRFPAAGGRRRDVLAGDSLWHEDFDDAKDRAGKVLIDAHVTFKLSRAGLSQCLRVEPRLGGCSIAAVRETLEELQRRV